jgi:acetoacetate decarboxylase
MNKTCPNYIDEVTQMKIDLKNISIQPLTGGGNYGHEGSEWGFGQSTEYLIQYRTDPKGIAEILPEPFKPAAEPTVTVLFNWMENDFLVDGGEYALSAILIDARFDGERDHYDGRYLLLMPENNNYTTLFGRDTAGFPKIMSDLPYPYGLPNGKTICECRALAYEKGKSQWQPYYGIELGPLEECDVEATKQYENALNSLPFFTMTVIPQMPQEGGYDVIAPQVSTFKRRFHDCWETKTAEFKLYDNLDHSLGLERRFVEAMKKLPVHELLCAIHWHADVGADLPAGKLK